MTSFSTSPQPAQGGAQGVHFATPVPNPPLDRLESPIL